MQRLAHGVPAKDKRFQHQTFALRIKVNFDMAVDAAPIEQNCFLRQPVQRRPASRAERHIHAGNVIGAAAIGPLGGLCGDDHITCGGGAAIMIRIATGNPAGGVHKNNLMRAAMATGEQRLGGARLIKTVKLAGAKGDIRRSARSLKLPSQRDRSIHHHESDLDIHDPNANHMTGTAHLLVR